MKKLLALLLVFVLALGVFSACVQVIFHISASHSLPACTIVHKDYFLN